MASLSDETRYLSSGCFFTAPLSINPQDWHSEKGRSVDKHQNYVYNNVY